MFSLHNQESSQKILTKYTIGYYASHYEFKRDKQYTRLLQAYMKKLASINKI